jgi:hypothetical protein
MARCLGEVANEGGPLSLLVLDGAVAPRWRGVGGDFERACRALRKTDAATLTVVRQAGAALDLRDLPSAFVFRRAPDELVIVGPQLDDDVSATREKEFFEEAPRAALGPVKERARVKASSGVLAILPATHTASGLTSSVCERLASHGGAKRFDWGVACAVKPGEYTLWSERVDKVESPFQLQARFWILPKGRKPPTAEAVVAPHAPSRHRRKAPGVATIVTVLPWHDADATVVNGVAFSHDGKWLAAGGHVDDAVRVWEVATWRLVFEARALRPKRIHRPQSGTEVAFSAGDSHLFARAEGRVHCWQTTSWRPCSLGRLNQQLGVGNLVAAGRDRVLAINFAYRLYFVEPGKWVRTPVKPDQERVFAAMAFTPAGDRLVVAGRGATIWDPVRKKLVRSIPAPPGGEYTSLAFFPDQKRLAFGLNDRGGVAIVSMSSGRELGKLVPVSTRRRYAPTTTVAVHPADGDVVATARDDDRSVYLQSVRKQALHGTLPDHAPTHSRYSTFHWLRIAFHPMQPLLAVNAGHAKEGGALTIHRVETP